MQQMSDVGKQTFAVGTERVQFILRGVYALGIGLKASEGEEM